MCGRSGELDIDSLEDVTMKVGRAAGLAMELTLPESEWHPRMVELLPSVSEEIIESGRGMTSTCSENPTLGRTPGALPLLLGLDGGVRTMLDIDCRI